MGRSRWTRAGTFGLVIAGALALAGCWDRGPSAPPVAREEEQTRAPRGADAASAPGREEAEAARAGDVADPVAEALGQAPLAPSFHALALGLAVDATTKVDVAVTGEATLFEVDLPASAVPLRRARAVGGGGAVGLFGRGWRSELESRVVAVGEGALVVRVQGTTPFVPLERDEALDVEGDVLVSLAGEVELLRRGPEGWELAAADGRVFAFDAEGRLAALVPGFRVEREEGRITLVGDEGGRVVLTLDGRGRVARAGSEGDEQAVEFEHDPARGELVRAGERRYEVDAQGRLVRAGELALEHDAAGRIARLALGGESQTYRFTEGRAEAATARGRFVYEQVDDGFVIQTPRGEDRAWLDARGRLVAFRRAGEATQVFERDDLEQPLVAADADPVSDEVARALGLRVTRDEAGRLREVLTPAGRRWTFGWDGGRLVSTDGPAGPVALRRDERGRVVSRRDASGRELFHEVDAHGAPLSVGARTGEQVVWTRDDEGRVLAIEAQDARGGSSRLDFAIDEETGAVIGVVLPGGESLIYGQAHDEVLTPWGLFAMRAGEDALPEALETPAGTFRFEHDAQGRRVATEYPNGLVVERTRDDAGRVVRQVARRGERALSTVESAWDERGRRVSATRDGVITRYGHDARGRLARLERDGQASAWSWNEDGDRTGETSGGARAEVRFDERGRIVSRRADGRVERFVHDEAGRLVERVVEAAGREGVARDRFDYDGFGRLVRVERAGASAVDYGYDPLGRVLTRTVDGQTTRFVHDGERLLAEVGPGARERVYVWGPAQDEPLAWGERAGRDAPWTWRFVVTSDLHTSLAHVDEQGRVVGADDLDPWGAGAAAAERPVFFAGHRVDVEAGLVPMRARWYDPSLGRFLTPDPAGLSAGPNAYVYVSGRPLDLVDPLGLQEAPREDEPGLLGRCGRWLGDKASGGVDTVVGAVEGAAYLTGLHGTASERAAARDASWSDLASGRAQSRAMGAIDGYVQGLTMGLIDPNTSRFAFDPEQARRGRAYGEGGALACGLISGRAALGSGLRAGAAGTVRGVRALPGAVSALPDALRALPHLVARAPGAAGRGFQAVTRGVQATPGLVRDGARATPGLVKDGLAWLGRNREPISRAVRGVVSEQARGAYRVTVGPFVNAVKALLHPVRTLKEAGRGIARMPRALREAVRRGRTARGSSRAGAATLADDAATLPNLTADDFVVVVKNEGQAASGGEKVGLLGEALEAADDLEDLADDVVHVSFKKPTGAGAAADDVAGQAGQVSPRGPQDGIVQALGEGPPTASAPRPRPGQGRPQSPRAPPADELQFVDDGTSVVARHEKGVVGSGHQNLDGTMSLDVHVGKAGLPEGSGYGGATIKGVHDAILRRGRDVTGLRADWYGVGDYTTNFKALTDNLREGMSLEAAAKATPTGKIAARLGFTELLPEAEFITNEEGKIVNAVFTFVKPPS